MCLLEIGGFCQFYSTSCRILMARWGRKRPPITPHSCWGLVKGRKGVWQCSNASFEPCLYANISQSSVCVLACNLWLCQVPWYKLLVLNCMPRWTPISPICRHGKNRKGMCRHSNVSLGPGLHANMGQSSVCVGLQLVISANSVAQAVGSECNANLKAMTPIATHSHWSHVKSRKNIWQHSNATSEQGLYTNMGQKI